MIEIDAKEIIALTHYLPYEDTKEDLIEALYALIPKIHKEIYCIDYELFIAADASIHACGRWRDQSAYTMHQHMHYMEQFQSKTLPVLCKEHHHHLLGKVIPPITALSLMKES